jgi:hypothetical protein
MKRAVQLQTDPSIAFSTVPLDLEVERARVAASRSSEPTVAESIPGLGSPSPTVQPGPEH